MDTKPAPSTEVADGTALKRFRPANLLSRIGISTKYARPEVVNNVIETCSKATMSEDTSETGKNSDFIFVYFTRILH